MQNGTRGNSPAAQTIPSHRLTTFFHSLKKFQRIPPKSHGPHLSALRKCIQSVRFASFALPIGLSFIKPSGRAFVTVAILLLSSHMNRAENRTLLQVPFCREWGCGRGDFGGKLAQLGVPCADVRTGGEIVWAKRVAHRLSLYLVRARNFLVALIPRSGTSPTSSLPAEYVLKSLSVFVRSVNEGSEQNSGTRRYI